MAESVVEKVARAMVVAKWPDLPDFKVDWWAAQPDHKAMARAAIEAMAANVSEEMVQAFHNNMEPKTDMSGWRYDAAIAAALRATLEAPK